MSFFNSKPWAKIPTDLLENKEKSLAMGRAGRIFVEQNFEQKEFIKRYMENRLMLLGGDE